LKTFKGHLDVVSDFLLINEKLLVSSSIGGSLMFWDFDSSKCIVVVLHSQIKNGWIALDLNGNYDHSENY